MKKKNRLRIFLSVGVSVMIITLSALIWYVFAYTPTIHIWALNYANKTNITIMVDGNGVMITSLDGGYMGVVGHNSTAINLHIGHHTVVTSETNFSKTTTHEISIYGEVYLIANFLNDGSTTINIQSEEPHLK